ncbi:MAG: RNase H family protein [Candidatus Halalkalibacterium sp. M3_1C_030]
MYHPAKQKEYYENPGGTGVTNTINRAELAGIYAAMLNKHTHIATDSACSLSQIRKQLLFPQLQRNHLHAKMIQDIASLVQVSPSTIYFYKVKAHAGIAGNEFADAIAKHSAQHDSGHDCSHEPVSGDGNPFKHMYWLSERVTVQGPQGEETRLCVLPNLKDQLKQVMQRQHRLGSAKTDTGYYSFWSKIKDKVNRKATNNFWTSCSLKEQCNVMRYRTGTLFNQKHAVRFKFSTDPSCPLCRHTDSALHILNGCQHTTMKKMITERHNKASKHIVQALKEGHYGANIRFTDIGSDARMNEQGIETSDIENRVLPAWMFPCLPNGEDRTHFSRPDVILLLPTTTCSTRSNAANSNINHFNAQDFNPRYWEIHLMEFKFCEDTRPENQLATATQQHAELISLLKAQGYHKVQLQTILCGAMGTIYTELTHKPLQQLGLNYYHIKKLTHTLNKVAIQCATQLISTRHNLALNTTNGGQGVGLSASARNPFEPP